MPNLTTLSNFKSNSGQATFSNALVTSNITKVDYTKGQIENIMLDLHGFFNAILNMAEFNGVNCISPKINNFPFIPSYEGGMVTSHGIAMQTKEDLITQLVTPFGTLHIKNDCNLASNETLARSASSFIATVKNEFNTTKCSGLDNVFAITSSEYYKKMLPQMMQVGLFNIKCANGIFAHKEHYDEIIKTIKELNISNTELTKALNETNTTLAEVRATADTTANQELTDKNNALTNALKQYAPYEHVITASSIDAISALSAKTAAGLSYLYIGKIEHNYNSYSKAGVMGVSALAATTTNFCLHKANQNYENFDIYLNGAAVIGGLILTASGFSVTPAMLLSAGLVYGIYYMTDDREKLQPYKSDWNSKETATEFATHLGTNLAFGIALEKLSKLNPFVHYNSNLDDVLKSNGLNVRDLTQVVRLRNTPNSEHSILKKDFVFLDYLSKSIPSPVNYQILSSGMEVGFNKAVDKFGLFNKTPILSNNTVNEQQENAKSSDSFSDIDMCVWDDVNNNFTSHLNSSTSNHTVLSGETPTLTSE